MRRPRAILLVLSLALAVSVAACGEDDDGPGAAPPPDGPRTLTVMTQNLFLGTGLEALLAPDADLLGVVDRLWANVLATDFPARARVLAQLVEDADPDLLALQEVSLWRSQTPGDALPTPNATTVEVDFLDALTDELTARGLDYVVVASVTNADFELPGGSGTDYRLTDRDVLLARRSLPVIETASGTFPHLATLTVPSPVPTAPPITLQIRRGWVSADVRAGGRTVRVFDTHLEAFSADIATQQGADLLQVAAPGSRPTIIAGDVNLPPGSAGYEQFLASGTRLRDAWTELNGADAGLTCCWNPDLRGGSLQTRIDVVFATPELRPTAVARVGEAARTPDGLFPSDHLGVVATFDVGAASTTTGAVATQAR